MKTKWLILLLMLPIALWLAHKHLSTEDTAHNTPNQVVHAADHETQVTEPNPLDETTSSQVTDAEATQKVNLTEQQNILNEISTRQFSDDAYVELRSMEWLIGLCGDTSLFVGSDTYYLQQQELAQDLQQKCTSLTFEFPNVLTLVDNEEKLNLFTPTSELGQLLKRSKDPQLTPIERNELSKLILMRAIQEENSAMMMEFALVTRWGANMVIPVADVLGSLDQPYMNQMSNLAFMQIACRYQGGQVCESTSVYMVLSCSQNPLACGLDFPAWYQKITLPGMQRDVETLINYYSQFSQ